MKRVVPLLGWYVCLLLVFVASPASTAFGGDRDRYRYIPAKRNAANVCPHMHRVLNKNFVYPWKRPSLVRLVDDPIYGKNSRFSFPKLLGVFHDDQKTLAMSYSRLPTSPEFDAIHWREGRVRDRLGSSEVEMAILVADFDINNDGQKETVIKNAFMLDYYVGGGSGGEDMLYVFPLLEKTPALSTKWESMLSGEVGGGKPALITLAPGVPYRLIRPFLYEGSIYLLGYEQSQQDNELREHMHIVTYQGGGQPLGVGERAPIKLEHKCLFRMMVIK